MAMRKLLFLLLLAPAGWTPWAAADEVACEVLRAEGSAHVVPRDAPKRPVAEGDLLKIGEVLEVGEGAFVDVAFDPDRKNLARFGARSRVTIDARLSTSVWLEYGSVFARLDGLPPESTFEVVTKSATVGVRGSAFDVRHDGTATEARNYRRSTVYVYPNVDGKMRFDREVRLGEHEAVRAAAGEAPPPRRMGRNEIRELGLVYEDLDRRRKELEASGRRSGLPDTGTDGARGGEPSGGGLGDETHRVRDLREGLEEPLAPPDEDRQGGGGGAGGGEGGGDCEGSPCMVGPQV
jgi:hypothetical protein